MPPTKAKPRARMTTQTKQKETESISSLYDYLHLFLLKKTFSIKPELATLSRFIPLFNNVETQQTPVIYRRLKPLATVLKI